MRGGERPAAHTRAIDEAMSEHGLTLAEMEMIRDLLAAAERVGGKDAPPWEQQTPDYARVASTLAGRRQLRPAQALRATKAWDAARLRDDAHAWHEAGRPSWSQGSESMQEAERLLRVVASHGGHSSRDVLLQEFGSEEKMRATRSALSSCGLDVLRWAGMSADERRYYEAQLVEALDAQLRSLSGGLRRGEYVSDGINDNRPITIEERDRLLAQHKPQAKTPTAGFFDGDWLDGGRDD